MASKPPLSPIATHRPQLPRRTSGSNTLPRAPRNLSQLGAVASLAVDGGLSEEELIRLGQNRHACPPPSYTPRASAIAARGGVVRTTPRRGHHTAPPGTVQIGRVIRVTRCDICLSPPNSGLCSFNSSRRSSPLHLTRVGGIAPEADRKASLPSLPADQLERVVRIGPGNSVSVGGHSYARINWHPQPYKSTSTDTSPPPFKEGGDVHADNAISSRISMISDIDNAESVRTMPVSPSAHSASSGKISFHFNYLRTPCLVRDFSWPI